MIDPCQHLYCPHLHFKKCRIQRQRTISQTIFPNSIIELESNAHIKYVNPHLSNIPTLAYENYTIEGKDENQQQKNFAKDYYVQSGKSRHKQINQIVEHLEQKLEPGNAYNLAANATKDYYLYAHKKQSYLKNARMRAKHNYNSYFDNKKAAKQKEKQVQIKWIVDLHRKIDQLTRHMYSKQIDEVDPQLQEKKFLREQDQNTSKKLSKMKISDGNVALEILDSIKALLLKKKVEFEQQRKNQLHNQSTNQMNETNTSQSQDISQASFISGATHEGSSKLGQSQIAEKYCDFDKLKLKWGAKNVEQVKQLIQRMLTKNVVCQAEGKNIRNLSAKRKIDNSLKQNLSIKSNKISKRQRQKQAKVEKHQKVVCFSESLSSEDRAIKQVLISGGVFDSAGQCYQRNRNYSKLFEKRQQSSICEFVFQPQPKLRQTLASAKKNQQKSTKSNSAYIKRK